MIDAIFRIAYFLGYRCARLVWRFTSPRINGALVAIWHDERVLLVRNSYRTEWTLPGGGIDIDEEPRNAAVRELKEELGLDISPSKLTLSASSEILYHNRRDHVTIFSAELDTNPYFFIDNREIVRAEFFHPREAFRLRLTPHVKDYIEKFI